MAELRAAHPNVPFLVPGIGAQGGDLRGVLTAGLDARGAGLLISASRSIIYAGRRHRGRDSRGRRAAARRDQSRAQPAQHSRRRVSLKRGIDRHRVQLVHDAVLHDEGDALHQADVVDRIAGHRHHIGDLATRHGA